MDHEFVKYLQEHNPTVRILRLENAPLIISFLFIRFKKQNKSIIPANELITNLQDYLFTLRQNYDDQIYPDSAKNYLSKWSNEGFLRKFYTNYSDEPVFQLTPATEKALDWINDLEKKEFVGTESRLLKIFDLLKEIVFQSSDDAEIRLTELNKEKEKIEKEIEKLKSGVVVKMSDTQIKERFMDVKDTARKLLSDFRQIEYNFRTLDRTAREKQMVTTVRKGKLLEEIFNVHDVIWETDQGRSFKAFWEFLMSQEKQDEFNNLIEKVMPLSQIQEISEDDFVERLKVNLVEAGDEVNTTTHSLTEQLRKLLDDKPNIELPMERPWFTPPYTPEMREVEIKKGVANINLEGLYSQIYVDPEELRERIRQLLKRRSQVTLKQVIEAYPVEKGVMEIVGYCNIATKLKRTIINDDIIEDINIKNLDSNKDFNIQLPQVIFCK